MGRSFTLAHIWTLSSRACVLHVVVTTPALLAHHGLRGELWGQALTYFRQAREQAVARSAYTETTAKALSCADQAKKRTS